MIVYTLEVRVESREGLAALIGAAQALEAIEFAMHPSHGTPDGSKAGKPGSKPPPGDRRAAGALKTAIRRLEAIGDIAHGLYAPQAKNESKRREAEEMSKMVARAKKLGAL